MGVGGITYGMSLGVSGLEGEGGMLMSVGPVCDRDMVDDGVVRDG